MGSTSSMVRPQDSKILVNMDLEKNDVLKEALFSMKFVAFKTPSASKARVIPKKLFFIFKFFSYKNIQTEEVTLYSQNSQALKNGTQYYLVVPSEMEKNKLSQKEYESVLESALTEKFEISAQQSGSFVKYLQEQTLQIDVWDSVSQSLHGSGRIQLAKLLRQG